MLTLEAIKEIESKIGYVFNSKALLSQAFSRSSYAEEIRMKGGKGLSNEQLEFYGDAVLNYVIVNALSIEHTTIDEEGNVHTRTQEELTNFRSYWTDKTMLSARMDVLGLSKYLLLSKGDMVQGVDKNKSAKEDLFEALIGAVWFDSNKDFKVVGNMVYKLLDLSFDEVCFIKNPISRLNELINKLNANKVNNALAGIRYQLKERENNFDAILSTDKDILFIRRIEESNIKLAEAIAAQAMLEYLEENGVTYSKKKTIDPNTVTIENAVTKLIEMKQKGIISVLPTYSESFDYEKGEWKVTCHLGDGSVFVQISKKKNEAKNKAAYQAFKYAYSMIGVGSMNGQVMKF